MFAWWFAWSYFWYIAFPCAENLIVLHSNISILLMLRIFLTTIFRRIMSKNTSRKIENYLYNYFFGQPVQGENNFYLFIRKYSIHEELKQLRILDYYNYYFWFNNLIFILFYLFFGFWELLLLTLTSNLHKVLSKIAKIALA